MRAIVVGALDPFQQRSGPSPGSDHSSDVRSSSSPLFSPISLIFLTARNVYLSIVETMPNTSQLNPSEKRKGKSRKPEAGILLSLSRDHAVLDTPPLHSNEINSPLLFSANFVSTLPLSAQSSIVETDSKSLERDDYPPPWIRDTILTLASSSSSNNSNSSTSTTISLLPLPSTISPRLPSPAQTLSPPSPPPPPQSRQMQITTETLPRPTLPPAIITPLSPRQTLPVFSRAQAGTPLGRLSATAALATTGITLSATAIATTMAEGTAGNAGARGTPVDRDNSVALPPRRRDLKTSSSQKLDDDPPPQSAGPKGGTGDTDDGMSATSDFVKKLYKCVLPLVFYPIN